MLKIINLNRGDVESKAIFLPDGICGALYSGDCRWGGSECYVLVKRNGNDIEPVGTRIKADM